MLFCFWLQNKNTSYQTSHTYRREYYKIYPSERTKKKSVQVYSINKPIKSTFMTGFSYVPVIIKTLLLERFIHESYYGVVLICSLDYSCSTKKKHSLHANNTQR